jgi:hypothetical protein
VPAPSTPPNTVVLLGTGAVSGSWAPVTRAIKSVVQHVQEGQENLAFADVVYDLRHRANIARRWRLGLPGMSGTMRRQLGTMLTRYESLTSAIARELVEASALGKLEARPFVSELRQRLEGSEYIVLTTNWDFVLEGTFPGRSVVHIHGDIDDAATLYLPAETSWEPYRELKWHSIHVGAAPVRKWHVWRRRWVRHPALWSLLSHANWLMTRSKRIVVGGLSFSPLDAELGHLLRSAVDAGRRRVPELVVLDPDPELVAQRVQYHAFGAIDRVRCFTPDQADQV